ncbi:hypothetical protein DENIS_0244 [Desulfonema ishimotonii]|uniref:Prepilin-type N-terminal cleavage/methylation domain-containing protein n=1 Tax=Desulfonema ishimotonii TaxID=45657 RepID=A0A401FQR9_9BACT|nr:PilW family protein [Desulfonema ishimotonii]GBC59307.1 hypothetical protein DENIS_0244 [Desulfonema ishimotonii]
MKELFLKKMKRDNSGFTLLELMIVTGIFMLVLIPVLGVFSSSYESYVVQDDISGTQENVRAGMLFMKRDVRMAGSGIKDLITLDGRLYGVEFENGVGDTGSDRLTIVYHNPDSSPCDDGNVPSGTWVCSDLPTVTLKDKMPETATAADVNEELKGSGWDEDCYCGGTLYTKPKFGYRVIITSPKGDMSNLLIVTGVLPLPDKLLNGPFDGFENKVLNTYPNKSTIRFFNEEQVLAVTYYLGGDNNDTLMRNSRSYNDDVGNPQPLAENIEDLQFALYGDFDGDNTVDLETPCDTNGDCINDESLTSLDGDTSDDGLIDSVRVVRISILGRTGTPHRELSPTARPGIEDHTAGSVDYYRRRLLQAEVKVRNLGL